MRNDKRQSLILCTILLQISIINMLVAGIVAKRSDIKLTDHVPSGWIHQLAQPVSSLFIGAPAARVHSAGKRILDTGNSSVKDVKSQVHSYFYNTLQLMDSIPGIKGFERLLRQSRFPVFQQVYFAQPIIDENFIATTYDLSFESCGKHKEHPEYGVTFSGRPAVRRRTVAVDPTVIPLGSRIHITFPTSYSHMNGWYVAEDTGNLVKGKIIDVFLGVSAYEQMKQFGSRKITVRILPPEENWALR